VFSVLCVYSVLCVCVLCVCLACVCAVLRTPARVCALAQSRAAYGGLLCWPSSDGK